MWQAAFPPEQQRCRVNWPHVGSFAAGRLESREPFVEVAHCRSQSWRDGLGLIPLVRRFGPPDKLVEWHEERPHALDTAELVSELSAQLCHSPGRDFGLVHHIMEQLHRLIELFLCNEQLPVQRIEDDADEQLVLADGQVPFV